MSSRIASDAGHLALQGLEYVFSKPVLVIGGYCKVHLVGKVQRQTVVGQEDYYCRTVGASCHNTSTALDDDSRHAAAPAPDRGAASAKCPPPSFGS